MNENATMAEFAEHLWRYYISQKVNQKFSDQVSFYRAQVMQINSDGTITVQKPFDNPIKVSKINTLTELSVGEQIVVLVFGNGARANHVAIGNGSMTNIGVPDIDGGVWPDNPLVDHETFSGAHQNLYIDGNTISYADNSDTLEEHKVNQYAHQNLMVDGNVLS